MRNLRIVLIHKRLVRMLIVSLLIFILLIGRLYWIQVKNHETLKVQALKQRGKEIKLSPDRGIIYDRNLISLTNRKKITTGFFFRDHIQNDSALRRIILENSDMSLKELNRYIKNKGTIVDIPLKSDALKNSDKEIFVVDRIERYDDENILSHVIGHINKSENRGEAGIEKVYDEILKNKGRNSLYVELDERKKKFIKGEHMVIHDADSGNPNGVKLTIDYTIQKNVERILDSEGKNGSVIVADVRSGDILAMVSRPNFNQNDITQYLSRQDMALYNKAIQVGYPPGSLFKLVVLLTAIEEDTDYLNSKFYCNGYEKLENIVINCNNRSGHGHISLKEAFSKSCNSAFIQLGQQLGSEKIIKMADKLGFANRINIGLQEEVKGNLPSGEDLLGPSIGNISIGQGSIEVTPLQITNLMMIVANNGIKKGMAVVEGITTKDGYVVKRFNREKDVRLISEKNCEFIREYLSDVVKNGTAQSLNLIDMGGAGGKTGSAEAVLKGKRTTHGWFCGYYPLNDPKYVITVFVEDEIAGSQAAMPIFENIVRSINK